MNAGRIERHTGAGAQAALVQPVGGLRVGILFQERVDLLTHVFVRDALLLSRQGAGQRQRCGGAGAEAHRGGELKLLDERDFTLPAEFRRLAWAHQSVLYELLMRCCWETVRTFSQNDRQLQGTPGAIAVLHTNTRQLEFHPHVHLVMPAAALDGTRQQWRTKRRAETKKGYLFNHKALAKVFRAKMLAAIKAAGLTLPQRHPEQWVVDCKSVGSGEKALIYLGRYLYRGVIAEKDIVACGNGQVSFRYRNAKTGQLESRTESGAHFLWLVLQHVLPQGFRRARNFGFLHPNCKRLIAWLHLLLKFDPGQTVAWFKKRAPVLCTCCGAVMVIVKTRIRSVLREPMPVTIVTNRAAIV